MCTIPVFLSPACQYFRLFFKQTLMLDQRIINLYDEYTHKPLTRKVFIFRLVQLAGSMTAAMSVLALLESGCTTPAKTASDELFIETVGYPGATGEMKA